MEPNSTSFCFATLALGSNYRRLALELAQDLEKYAPHHTFVILTDNPRDFQNIDNIMAFQHTQRFCLDNDKSFLIEKSLSMFDTCILIDADMRILAPISPYMEWQPGITARSLGNLVKHHQTQIDRTNPPRPSKVRELQVIKELAIGQLDLDLAAENIRWIHEFLFVVKKDAGKELDFIKWMKRISSRIELNGVMIGCGSAMGLAAAKAGFPVRPDEMKGIDFFDDRIEKVRISKGEADPNAKLIYFEKLKSLKYPQRSFLQKIAFKLEKTIGNLKRGVRLRFEKW